MPFYAKRTPNYQAINKVEHGDQTVLFNRTAKTIKKWKAKAMLADPHKTRITIELSKKRTHVPPWIYKDLVEPSADNNSSEQ